MHGLFVSSAGAAGIVAWRFNEDTRARISHQNRHDRLTGLPNRLLFADRLEQALARRGRQGVDAVMLLDIDDFKLVNDSLGHQAGEDVLVEFARRLIDVAPAGASVARFGGDEFALLAHGLASAEAALDAATLVGRECC